MAVFMALLSGCNKKLSQELDPSGADTSTSARSDSPNKPIDKTGIAPLDYLGALSNAKTRSTQSLSLIPVQQAVQLFQGVEGRNPASLEELTGSGHIGRLPQPPTGQKFTYDPKTGKVELAPAEGASARSR